MGAVPSSGVGKHGLWECLRLLFNEELVRQAMRSSRITRRSSSAVEGWTWTFDLTGQTWGLVLSQSDLVLDSVLGVKTRREGSTKRPSVTREADPTQASTLTLGHDGAWPSADQ